MSKRPQSHLLQYHVWEPKTDRIDFQWQARLLQSLWREEHGFAAGEHGGKTRGALLAMPEAQEKLTNYLTPKIREVVNNEVTDRTQSKGKLYSRPRIYNNLLSSQPLCFNLFAELRYDLGLASTVLAEMSDGRIDKVLSIDFEYSPGRSKGIYTGDRSAFDVYVRYQTPSGEKGFAGIEVKYHEGLKDAAADHRPRYDEVAAQMGCFHSEHLIKLHNKPLQQVWRDHLLVGAHQIVDGFQDALFVFLYPKDNTACFDAVEQYAQCLNNNHSFQPWTLENIIQSLTRHSNKPWIQDFHYRYLDFSRLDL